MQIVIRNMIRAGAIALLIALCFESNTPRILTQYESVAVAAECETGEILRLHIVANSDDEEDQRVKLLVRDALLQEFSPAKSLKDAQSIVKGAGSNVLKTVQGVLAQESCAYGAQLRFGRMEFPQRIYGDIAYPAGEYEALRVELGQAQGQNWWCVLFPPICLLDIAVSDIPGDAIVFESDFLKWILG